MKEQDVTDLNHLDELLAQLMRILQTEETADTANAERILGMMRRNISIAMSCNASRNEIFPLLQSSYRSLFPPKAGLSEFHRWSEDYEVRVSLNQEYETLKRQIENLLPR